jgi:hypothetical protein
MLTALIGMVAMSIRTVIYTTSDKETSVNTQSVEQFSEIIPQEFSINAEAGLPIKLEQRDGIQLGCHARYHRREDYCIPSRRQK